MNRALFNLGMVVATPGALEALSRASQGAREFINRHQSGDWGDCCEEDSYSNDCALKNGSRIFSVYHTKLGDKIWCITEWNRSSTTLLTPDEY